MQWTMDDHKRYLAEHLERAERARQIQEAQNNPTPLRRGILGKRRARKQDR